jgi:chemotaxis-related protein WspD
VNGMTTPSKTPRRVKDTLFDRDVPEDYLREWTTNVASKKKATRAGTRSVVIFRIETEWLALPTEVLQEVVDPGVVRTVPQHKTGVLRGLVNVRGELLLCVSLAALLGIEEAALPKSTEKRSSGKRLVICNRKGDRLAFLADEVEGCHRYHPEDLRDVPATLAKASAGTYILSLLPWRDRTAGCLDDELLFYALNRGLA